MENRNNVANKTEFIKLTLKKVRKSIQINTIYYESKKNVF